MNTARNKNIYEVYIYTNIHTKTLERGERQREGGWNQTKRHTDIWKDKRPTRRKTTLNKTQLKMNCILYNKHFWNMENYSHCVPVVAGKFKCSIGTSLNAIYSFRKGIHIHLFTRSFITKNNEEATIILVSKPSLISFSHVYWNVSMQAAWEQRD